MKTDNLIKSTLVARATAEVDEQIQEELNIPDPHVDKAMATITGEVVEVDDDTEEKDEDDNGGN